MRTISIEKVSWRGEFIKEKRDYHVPRATNPDPTRLRGGDIVARIKCATTQGRQSRYNPILRGGPREKKIQPAEQRKSTKKVRQRGRESREILSRPRAALSRAI